MSEWYVSYEHHGLELPYVSMDKNHYHIYMEVYYLEKGECNYFVGGRTYRATSGDVIIIPQSVIHRTTYTAPYSRSVVHFDNSFLTPPLLEKLTEIPYLYRNKESEKEIKEIFDTIRAEMENPDFYTEDSVKSLVCELLILMMRKGGSVEKREKEMSFVELAVKFILQNYTSHLTLSDVAKHLSVSAEHLSRCFKRETGFGFNEYVTLLRLKKAEELIKKDEDKSILDIAFLCGFNDSNYFSDKFKKTYGISPLKFRKNLNNTALHDKK